jgi:energy-coupling factor transport system permease protein
MRFKRQHPVVPFFYYIGLTAFIFIHTHPIFQLTCAAGVITLAFFFAGAGKTAGTLRFIIPMGIIFGLLNPLFVRRGATILFYLFGNPVTLEATVFGVSNVFTLVSVVALFISFNVIIDQASFLYLTARWIPKTSFIINMALYNASRFKYRLTSMAGVQRTKGIYLDEGTLRERISSAFLLLGAFTVRCLEEGMETAEVLKARDYGTTRRRPYQSHSFSKRDAVLLVVLISVWLTVLFGALSGAASFDYYPEMSPLALDGKGFTLYLFFLFYLFFPACTKRDSRSVF